MSNVNTSERYDVKREIVSFAKALGKGQSAPTQKFLGAMLYGVIASGSVLLSRISECLKEKTKKANSIKRLSRHLSCGLPKGVMENYRNEMRKSLPKNPLIILDGTDIIKPCGKKFEKLGKVKDGSSKDGSIENGYFCCEAAALSSQKNPVSLYGKVYSQKEEGFVSQTEETFKAIDASLKAVKGRATFVLDRGYDNQRIFNYIDEKGHDFVIRMSENRNYLIGGKWLSAERICSMFKGKYRVDMKFEDRNEKCRVTPVRAGVKKFKGKATLLIVYRPEGRKPLLLLTNKKIKGKEDTLSVCFSYRLRWRIEEYFKFKKQSFGFEGFRVRSLKAINCLNDILTFCITFTQKILEKRKGSKVRLSALEHSNSLKKEAHFMYHRIAKGLKEILKHCREGIGGWFKRKRDRGPRQLCFKLEC
jgi:hypothetical protein